MKNKRTILKLDLNKKNYNLESLTNRKIIGPIDYAILENMNTKTYDNRLYDNKNPFIFGCGPFAGSEIPGTGRLSFFAKSPLWHSLFTSNMGGAALSLVSAGVDMVNITGKTKNPCIISVYYKNGKTEVQIKPILKKNLSLIYDGYKGLTGVYAIQKYTIDAFANNYVVGGRFPLNTRVLSVGPAAFMCDFAVIGSTIINTKGELESGRDDWSGRGGMGSLLAQAHNVVAIIFGGSNKKERLGADKLFQKALGKTIMQAAIDATSKYRYVDNLKTGGTFGVNFHNLQEKTLINNWNVDISDKKLKEIYDKKIKAKYLDEFNKRIIDTKSWATCGEACPALCKKIDKKTKAKIDYEPYSASGPNSGIFDLKKSEKINLMADAYGVDAIEFGNMLSFLLDCITHGLLTPADFDLNVDINFSKNQEKLAEKVMILIISGNGIGTLLSQGIRHTVKTLNIEFKTRTKEKNITFSDLAVYIANGKKGSIAPIQYLVLGAFMPLPIQGKFLTHYGSEFLKPHDTGLKDAQRFIEELGTDNLGICRFHRGWSETMQDLLLVNMGYGDNYTTHMRTTIQKIVTYNKLAETTPQFWESKKVIHLIAKDVERKYKETPKNENLKFWYEKFKKDELGAAKEYWQEVLAEMERVFEIKLV
ncbi:hypothetical protein GQ473_01930 [archaeon]|nr:hypothetical protein [archaeon]